MDEFMNVVLFILRRLIIHVITASTVSGIKKLLQNFPNDWSAGVILLYILIGNK